MKQKFYVGDRVVGNGIQDGIDISGMTGTVVRNSDTHCCVEFDDRNAHFHSCSGYAKNHHGWICKADLLDLYCEIDDWNIASDICAVLL